MDWLSALGLADLAGTTVEEIQRLVDLGVLITDGAGRFRTSARHGRIGRSARTPGSRWMR
jgi:hypothetical protein